MSKKNKTKVVLPETLGFVPDPPDERDLKYEEIMGAAPPAMPTFEEGFSNQEKYGKLRDDHQGYSLGCVSFGSTNDVEMMIRIKTGKEINLSQRFIYSQIHLSNGGASPRDAYKLINQVGVPEEKWMPVTYGWSLTEAQMRSTNGLEEAKKHADWKIGAYRSISSGDISTLAQAIFENGGCGGGYLPLSKNIGHFIFFDGYGMHNSCRGLEYQDSYSPFKKWIVQKNGNWYLDRPSSSNQVQLFSIWTAMAGEWEVPMDTKLVKKKGQREVFLQTGGKRFWIKSEESLKTLVDGGLIGISDINEAWKNIFDNEVDVFETPYEGDIIGKPDFGDWLKNVLGFGQ